VHRVTVGDDNKNEWIRLPLGSKAEKLYGKCNINEVLLKDSELHSTYDNIKRVYGKTRYWKIVEPIIKESLTYTSLSNSLLFGLYSISHLLGLKTRLELGIPYIGDTTTNRVASQLSKWGKCIYLAGVDSKDYLDIPLYEQLTGQTVQFYEKSKSYTPYNTVSILSLICNLGVDKTKEIVEE